MTVGPEAQLILLAVALYVQDAALLLRPDEAILAPTWRGRWRLTFSSDSARFGAKELYLPNLFAVHQPLFRGSWSPEAAAGACPEDWQALAPCYRSLVPVVLGIAVILFAALPAALLLDWPLLLKLSLVGTMYAYIVLALVWLYWHRKALPLSSRKLGGLMLECLICPPIAANLVRRLSLAVSIRQDLLIASRQLLDGVAWDNARAEFAERLQTMLYLEVPGTARHTAATDLLARLRSEVAIG